MSPAPSGSSIKSSTIHEEVSDDLFHSQRCVERVYSSDTNDETAGSDCEDSSEGNALDPPQTEYGSLMESTDFDEHDE